jgi:2-dehydro-3-deoxyphosphogluconate aldolase/(4S)-4-hydroxy-2-oxoglutarate aldolase
VIIREIVALAPVIPILTITDLAHAVPLARALSAGGLRVLEITLRGPVAIAAVEAVRKSVPEAIVGVGTLTRAVEFAAAARVGAQFGVAPGLTPELASAARGARFPLLPGVMTPTEVIATRNAGFDLLTLFPAQQAGGIGMLQALGNYPRHGTGLFGASQCGLYRRLVDGPRRLAGCGRLGRHRDPGAGRRGIAQNLMRQSRRRRGTLRPACRIRPRRGFR